MERIHSITSNGRTLTADVEGTELIISIDGTRLGRLERKSQPETRNGTVVTHRAGDVAIRKEFADAIEVAWQAHPVGRAQALRVRRLALAVRLDSLHDEEHTLRSREIARGGRMATMEMAAQIAAARNALDAFDAEHPQVTEALRAEREARRRENIVAGGNA
jgi:hypothetical protein